MEDTVSPRVLAKMVYAGVRSCSFAEGSEGLSHLADCEISSERVRRACTHVGEDRIEQQDALQEAYQAKSLPQQSYGKPADVESPEIACVMADGGRYQHLDRSVKKERASARKGNHWKESRIGVLLRMSGERHAEDPQPTLPPELGYAALAEVLSEMGKTGGKLDRDGDPEDDESAKSAASDGLVGPTLDGRQVVASRQSWEDFGPLLASQAWYAGFAAATRQVFVSDGSAAIEKLQRTHFSHYTSVLDILHALAYSLAAARAVSQEEKSAQEKYDAWAAKIWAGDVEHVIDELIAYAAKFGQPPPDAASDDPREIIRRSRVFYENHTGRMNYPEYRQQGFPLTSSLMESTVKQINRRVKGSEKYWSSVGGEAILRLRADYLSDHQPINTYFQQRAQHATGTRHYRTAKQLIYA